MDDNRILELFWERSEQVIDAVDEKYGNMCRQIAMNLLRNEQDAEECVNDTYHALWDTIPPERPQKLPTFIAKITRHLAMKRLRYRNAAKRATLTVSFEELNECLPDSRTVEGALEGKALTEALDRFLDTLEPQSRNLFLRRYWFFDSVKEIARGFGMSESKVKVSLHRIRKELKNYLEEAQIYVG